MAKTDSHLLLKKRAAQLDVEIYAIEERPGGVRNEEDGEVWEME